MKQKVYLSKRLEIRAWKLQDHAKWNDACATALPKQDEYDIDLKKATIAKFKKTVLRHRQVAKEDRAYIWNLFVRSTGEFIGWIDIATTCREPYQMANLGYFIINRHRGKGYATEALQKLIPGIFKDLKFHRLEAVTDPNNKPSIALAKAAGLHKEGIKKHYYFQNNRWEDQMTFIAVPELFGK